MTTCSLYKEIECLNEDIDICEGMLNNKTGKRYSCPPNCYCDKRTVSSCRTVPTTTKPKTASATVTKCDISPKSRQNVKNSTSKSKTPNYDYYDFEPCPRTKTYPTSTKCMEEEKLYNFVEHMEPVKLTTKRQHVTTDPSWSSILQNNNIRDEKKIVSPREKDLRHSNSNSSLVSTLALESRTVYMKSKGIQCDEIHSPKPKQSPKNDPFNSVQNLLYNMKSKLKHDPSLASMVDEMEHILGKIPAFDRGDSRALNDIPKEGRTSFCQYLLNPTTDYQASRDRLEATYRELEATCSRLKIERDTAIENASQKSLELIESMKREAETKAKLNETNVQIKEMSAKLETYTKSMEGLTDHVKRLQRENKDLDRIRGQVSQLSKMMRDVTQENKSLLSELQLATIERNKLEVELAMKEQELQKKSKELENVTQLLMKSTKSAGCQTDDVEWNMPRAANCMGTFLEDQQQQQKQQQQQHGYRNETSSRPTSPHTIAGEEDHEHDEAYSLLQEQQQPIARSTSVKRPSITAEVQQQPNLNEQQQPDVNKIEKLKDEIRRMFNEMRELAQDDHSIPALDLSPNAESSEVNWSEMSNTYNSYESVSDLQSSDFNHFLERNKFTF
ncbi:hypothetical protein O3M35_006888 [Rhynocoris fuscipes]|uniref:Uncharacterized protein n=1 Tax=Rhynocoris fuscipes TaxID=488301 RepID=A0AAW1DIW1_9HEMI